MRRECEFMVLSLLLWVLSMILIVYGVSSVLAGVSYGHFVLLFGQVVNILSIAVYAKARSIREGGSW